MWVERAKEKSFIENSAEYFSEQHATELTVADIRARVSRVDQLSIERTQDSHVICRLNFLLKRLERMHWKSMKSYKRTMSFVPSYG